MTVTTRSSGSRGPRNRLSPEERRAQLLDLGVRLLATRSLDELSIDLLAEEAGISRGLLYHYFGNKHDFHEAVVRRAADELIEQTAPPAEGEPLERLLASMTAYVDYVVANYEGYLSLVKGAASGNDALRRIYDDALTVLTDRVFTEDAHRGAARRHPGHPARGPRLGLHVRGRWCCPGPRTPPASPAQRVSRHSDLLATLAPGPAAR